MAKTETELMCAARGYWAFEPAGGNELEKARARQARYLEEVLADEIEHARARLDAVGTRGGLLVLMLGWSVEPLLLSILAHRPSEVLVVHSCHYQTAADKPLNGRAWFRRFKELVEEMAETSAIEGLDGFVAPRVTASPDRPLGVDKPEQVFDAIRRWVIPKLTGDPTLRGRIVIDITGAKKSMVTGAYLFATFARATITYVDFDRYDPDYQRPYGFSCRFEPLESPEDGYHLDAWRRAYQQYRHSAFGALIETLDGVLGQMRRIEDLFGPADIDATERLREMARCFARWAEGDYKGALAAWEKAGSPEGMLPSAVPPLANWPDAVFGLVDGGLPRDLLMLETGSKDECKPRLGGSIFNDPERLLTYARDEIEKVRRLVEYSDDYRSALLRAAGLNEVLLKYRVIERWLARGVEIKREGQDVAFDDVDQMAIENGISGVSNAANFIKFLEGRELKAGGYKLRIPEAEGADESPAVTLTSRGLARLRNKAVHFTLPVTEKLAREAHARAELSVNKVDATGRKWSCRDFTPGWDALCNACGIGFLPPLDPADDEEQTDDPC